MSPTEQSGRILALDLGARRIGVAVSDGLGITAQGLPTLERSNKRADFGRLREMVERYEVREIVVGHPVHLSGDESAQSRRAAEFAEELRRRFQLPVHLMDERLTSAQANRVLRETAMSIKRRGKVVDRMAATLILESFLERRTRT